MNKVKHYIKKILPRKFILDVISIKEWFKHSLAQKRLIENDKSLVKLKHIGKYVVSKRVNRFSSYSSAIDNLDLAVSVAKASGIKYFLIPGFSPARFRIGIHIKDREKYIESLSRTLPKHGAYISYSMGGRNKAVIISDRKLPAHTLHSRVIRLFVYKSSEKDTIYSDEGYGCDVEFWIEGSDFAKLPNKTEKSLELGLTLFEGFDFKGSLIAPRKNKISSIITSDQLKFTTKKIGDKKYKTLKPFNSKIISDINFPIDIVYTWVDSDDPQWKEKYQKHKGEIGRNTSNNTMSRFISRDELKYSLRSLYMYGSSFIRNIYIVTDGQVPTWLKLNTPGVKIISHSDIFSKEEYLPVFNSHAIGAQLHRIPGLSSNYIYFNDDIFLGRHTDGSLFFHPNKLVKVLTSRAQIGMGKPNEFESAPSSAGKNVRTLLEDSFGVSITNKFKHAPVPQLKELAYEMEERYHSAVHKTISSRFRSSTDIAFAGLLHHSYALITGRAVESNYRISVVNISSSDARESMQKILSSKRSYAICLNDTSTPEEKLEEVNNMVVTFLEDYFPFPSPWEK